jgi:hypothetical protein
MRVVMEVTMKEYAMYEPSWHLMIAAVDMNFLSSGSHVSDTAALPSQNSEPGEVIPVSYGIAVVEFGRQ